MKTLSLILLLPLAIALGGCKPKGRSVAEVEGVYMLNSKHGILLDHGVISSRPKVRSEEIERMAANGLLLALSDSFDLLRKDNERLTEHVRCLEVNQEMMLKLLALVAGTNTSLHSQTATFDVPVALLNLLERAEVKP